MLPHGTVAHPWVHNVCTRSKCAKAQLVVEQSECRPVGDWGGGPIVLWDVLGEHWAKCECCL